MAYGKKLRYSKKPFENAERYQYKTLLGKTRDIYCSGEPVPESTVDLVGDLIVPIGVAIVGIVTAVVKLRKAGTCAYLFQMSTTELSLVAAMGGLAILLLAGSVFWRIRRFSISRRKYTRAFGMEGEDDEEYQSIPRKKI